MSTIVDSATSRSACVDEQVDAIAERPLHFFRIVVAGSR
jgi:hypothetical protein